MDVKGTTIIYKTDIIPKTINIICYDILVMVVWFFCCGVQAYCSSSTTGVITKQQQLNHR